MEVIRDRLDRLEGENRHLREAGRRWKGACVGFALVMALGALGSPVRPGSGPR